MSLYWLHFVFCVIQTEGERPADNRAGGRQPDQLHPDGPGSRSGVQRQHHRRDRRQEGSRERHRIHDPWAGCIYLFYISLSLSLFGQFGERFEQQKMYFWSWIHFRKKSYTDIGILVSCSNFTDCCQLSSSKCYFIDLFNNAVYLRVSLLQ